MSSRICKFSKMCIRYTGRLVYVCNNNSSGLISARKKWNARIMYRDVSRSTVIVRLGTEKAPNEDLSCFIANAIIIVRLLHIANCCCRIRQHRTKMRISKRGSRARPCSVIENVRRPFGEMLHPVVHDYRRELEFRISGARRSDRDTSSYQGTLVNY